MEFTSPLISRQQLKKLRYNHPCNSRQVIQRQASQKINSFYQRWPLHEFRERLQRLIKTRDLELYEDTCSLMEAIYTLYELELIVQSSKKEYKGRRKKRSDTCKGCVFK